MSYHLGLGERAKERVDRLGHIILTEQEATHLAWMKVICTVTSVFSSVWFVRNGAVFAAIMAGAFCALIFKLSELVTSSKTLQQKVVFVVKAVVAQMASVALFFGNAEYGEWD